MKSSSSSSSSLSSLPPTISGKRVGKSFTCTSSFIAFSLVFMAVGSILTFWFIHIANGWHPGKHVSEAQLNHVAALVGEIRKDQDYLMKLVDKNVELPSHRHAALNNNQNSNSNLISLKPTTIIQSISTLSSSSSVGSSNLQDKLMDIGDNPFLDIDPTQRHPILTISDDKFRNTPISEMYRWYGQAGGGGTCEEDFGYKLVEKWKGTKKSYCNPAPNSNSLMDCYLIKQTKHHGNGDNLCLMKDVSMKMSIFNEEWYTDRLVKEYVSTKHARQPYIDFPKGFIESECTPTSEWLPQYFPGWNWNVSYEGFAPKSPPFTCDITIDHNVLIIQRDTFANFFHDSEDFFNYFVAMSVFDWSLENTQVYLTDLYPEGPFWPIWDKVFSGKYKAKTSFQLASDFKQYKGKKVCFKNLGVGIYGPAAPITVASWDTPCRGTALVKAYSDFVIRGLGLHSKSVYLDKNKSSCSEKKEVTVTFLARRSSSEWPEKKFCNNTHSFFKCQHWAGPQWGTRKLGRVVKNEAELIDRLKTLNSFPFSNGAKVTFQDVDFNVLSFEEQILVDLQTDVLIGPHGAGLMHNIFMPDRATLIEIFIDGSTANRHFHNLAHWYGREYKSISSNNPVDVNNVFNMVKETVSSLRFRC